MAMRLLNSLVMTPTQPEAHDRSDVTTQCLANMPHRDAGDCLYPGGIVKCDAIYNSWLGDRIRVRSAVSAKFSL